MMGNVRIVVHPQEALEIYLQCILEVEGVSI
jgi:hypothetical protein